MKSISIPINSTTIRITLNYFKLIFLVVKTVGLETMSLGFILPQTWLSLNHTGSLGCNKNPALPFSSKMT